MDKEGEEFGIKIGVRQGNPMLSNLFNSVLEQIFRNIEWEKRNKNEWEISEQPEIRRWYHNNKRIPERAELKKEGEKVGLRMNLAKTKLLSLDETAKLRLGESDIYNWWTSRNT